MEGPNAGDGEEECRKDGWAERLWSQLARTPAVSGVPRRSDLRLLLGVMGAPLAPVHVCAGEPLPHLSIKDTPIVSIAAISIASSSNSDEISSAHYILQQYTAASGGVKVMSSIHNSYAMGKMRMVASEFETSSKVMKNQNSSRNAESGGFVLWQMAPEMWYVELAVGVGKIRAGCNGKTVWRHTPWLGTHAAKGPVRPLRRTLQVYSLSLHLVDLLCFMDDLVYSGSLKMDSNAMIYDAIIEGKLNVGLDPVTTASMFSNSHCIGEKKINGEDCFILKLSADPQTLKARSEGPAEIIRHVMFGYFSQKSALLVHVEDSHLTRIQSNSGGDAVYWETTINSSLDDYRSVEGVMVAHSGRSVVTLFRFGDVPLSHTKTRMEEAWTIEEVAFNVPGLSLDCFIPPADLKSSSIGESCDLLPQNVRGKTVVPSFNRAKWMHSHMVMIKA
ncbi:hypothetical protein KSP39_PZI002390 [Platanthera zijinensis]|uniref:Uncharacterized protein n=1 Tax=Platanthera zijinensis TaxID=2320716 RepID=A0AAP0GEB8_9ASPA